MKYHENYRSVAETPREQLLWEKGCCQTHLTQGCHKPSLRKKRTICDTQQSADETRGPVLLRGPFRRGSRKW